MVIAVGLHLAVLVVLETVVDVQVVLRL